MMVQFLDAYFACVAMNCPWWPVNCAITAILHPQDMRFDAHIVLFVDKSISPPFHLVNIQWNLVTLWSFCSDFRHYSRVDEWENDDYDGLGDVESDCDDFEGQTSTIDSHEEVYEHA